MNIQQIPRLNYLINQFGVVFDILYARFGDVGVVQVILASLPDNAAEFFYARVTREIMYPGRILVFTEEINDNMESLGVYIWSWWSVEEIFHAFARDFDINDLEISRLIRASRMIIFAADNITLDALTLFVQQ